MWVSNAHRTTRSSIPPSGPYDNHRGIIPKKSTKALTSSNMKLPTCLLTHGTCTKTGFSACGAKRLHEHGQKHSIAPLPHTTAKAAHTDSKRVAVKTNRLNLQRT